MVKEIESWKDLDEVDIGRAKILLQALATINQKVNFSKNDPNNEQLTQLRIAVLEDPIISKNLNQLNIFSSDMKLLSTKLHDEFMNINNS